MENNGFYFRMTLWADQFLNLPKVGNVSTSDLICNSNNAQEEREPARLPLIYKAEVRR